MPAPPLGETLTWPPSPLGAVATKKTCWRSMNARRESSIASNTLAMEARIARRRRGRGGAACSRWLRIHVLEVLLRLLQRLLGLVRDVGVVLHVLDRV